MKTATSDQQSLVLGFLIGLAILITFFYFSTPGFISENFRVASAKLEQKPDSSIPVALFPCFGIT